MLAGVVGQAGFDVEVVARPSTASVINERGISLRSKQYGDIDVKVPARTEPTPGSLVVIAAKSYTIPEISDSIAASKPQEIVALCNGITHRDVVHEIPSPRTTCGSIRIISERVAPGQYLHHSAGSIITLEDAAKDWDIPRILTKAGMDVRFGGSEKRVLWDKLRFLAPMALLTASTGATIGPAREGSEPLLEEIAAITSAEGVPTTASELMDNLASIDDDADSSLGRDVNAGNRTELDALGHDLVRIAATHSIPTPVLEQTIASIERRSHEYSIS